MSGATRQQQRGAVTLIGALFLIIILIVLLGAVQRMAATDIIDSALGNDAIEALFLAETGVERAAWRYAGGTTNCAPLAGETDTTGRGSFLILSAVLTGSLCQVRVQGSVTTTTLADATQRTVDAELLLQTGGFSGWAVGVEDAGQAGIAGWDGSSWSQPGPYAGVPATELFGVTCVASDDCWAVGADTGGEVILHWDGSLWSRVGPSGAIPNAILYSVQCVASNDCWAVGEDSGGELMIHWDGSNWSRVGPYGGIPNKKLFSVHCVASNDCWAVGEKDGNNANIIHWDGSSWSSVSGPGNSKNLNSVHCIASNDCWAVGEKTTGNEFILHWDGSSWSRLGPYGGIPNEDLNGIHMVSATEGYATGNNGTFAVWNGSTWTSQASPTGEDIYAVAFAPGGGGGGGGGVQLVSWTEVIQ